MTFRELFEELQRKCLHDEFWDNEVMVTFELGNSINLNITQVEFDNKGIYLGVDE